MSATTCSHTERDRIPEDALNCPRELKEVAAGPETARLDEEGDTDLISGNGSIFIILSVKMLNGTCFSSKIGWREF